MIKRAFQFVLDKSGPLEGGLVVLFLYWIIRLIMRWLGGEVLQDDTSFALQGMMVMGLCFVVLLRVLEWLAGFGSGIMGVASTVIKEALNIRLVGMVVLILVIMLPWLAVTIASGDKLSYRVQAYLEYSLSLVMVLLSLMTVLLGCRTLSKEMEDKQIMIVGVKPVSRPMYLLGKWLGIMFLNVLLILVSMGSVFYFTSSYLSHMPAKTAYERAYVKDGLLAGNVTVMPKPAADLGKLVKQQMKERLERNPEDVMQLGRMVALKEGKVGQTTNQQLQKWGQEKLLETIQQQVLDQWMSIKAGNQKTYVFEGLQELRRMKRSAQIRYKVNSSNLPRSRELVLAAQIGGRMRKFEVTLGQEEVLIVPWQNIDEKGQLVFSVLNVNAHPDIEIRRRGVEWKTIHFSSTHGMELYYPKVSFATNYIRAMFLVIIKLGFLAMMSLVAATFLGFPVAVLMALLICMTASFSDFFLSAAQDLDNIKEFQQGFDVQLQGIAGLLGKIISTVMLGYSQYKPVGSLVDGRLISWNDVLSCLFWIGLLWTGMTGAIGMAVFRSRELARVQV